MPKEIKIIEFRGVGGLQGRQEAKEQAIYENLKILFDAVNEINHPRIKPVGRPKIQAEDT
jgi:hypothetical protein